MSFRTVNVPAAMAFLAFAPALPAAFFSAGNLVVSVEGNGVVGATSGAYTDNQAAPLTLFQYSPNGTGAAATYVNSLVFSQTANPVSGEYGSSSEGALTLSGNGKLLSIAGYGINAATFNQNYNNYAPAGDTKPAALAQSGSQTGQSAYTPIARVVALIDSNGNVDASTAIYNIFSGNNPRSTYTVDGSGIYVSGQGSSPTADNSGGVFYATKGSSSATSITGNDGGSGTSQDTRIVQIYNGQLYVSLDSKSGATNRDFVGTLGTAGNPPTTVANGGNGPTSLTGFGGSTNRGSYSITTNGNGLNTGKVINLSPESFFFAAPNILYVADSGIPKNTAGSNSTVGNGGLQKWTNSNADGSGTWTLNYTLYNGLGLVTNSQTAGTTGLLGLTARVNGSTVDLFATNYTIGDLDQTYLYGITDTLSATTAAQVSTEVFTALAAAPVDSNFKGVAFAPTGVPEPAPALLMGLGVAGIFTFRRLRRY